MAVMFQCCVLLALSPWSFKIRIPNVGNVLTEQCILLRCVYPNCTLSRSAHSARICFMFGSAQKVSEWINTALLGDQNCLLDHICGKNSFSVIRQAWRRWDIFFLNALTSLKRCENKTCLAQSFTSFFPSNLTKLWQKQLVQKSQECPCLLQ